MTVSSLLIDVRIGRKAVFCSEEMRNLIPSE